MYHTQVELTDSKGHKEVWWLPVPQGRAKVGEKITTSTGDRTITQVCTTVDDDAFRHLKHKVRIASGFTREAQTLSYMSI